MKKRLLCLFLTIVLIMPLLMHAAPEAYAAIEQSKSKQNKSKAIGIVFDNSGSMYGTTNSSWCRATYAMEVFASMMNDEDVLQIYPMHDIKLGKDGTTTYSKTNPLVINGPSEADNIRQIYTPSTSTTPFDTVTLAYQGLLNTTADEKYLIIITDGNFDSPMNSVSQVTNALDEYSQHMNIMFLGIGNVSIPTVTNPSKQYYEKAADSAQVLSKLTAMCNRIFGRDTLELTNDTVDFDVSLGKLIVFVQGENVSDVQVNGGTKVSERDMKYSELGRGNSSDLIDSSLQGMIVTYENLDAGSYDLSYSGQATSISVYYEPDVDLQIQLLDEGGNVVDFSDELYAGSYTLTYGMVDKNGVPTTSALLGSVDYDITYTIDGQDYHIQTAQGGSEQIDLAPGSTLDGSFNVSYLGDYTIRKSSQSLGWPVGGINITFRPVGEVSLQVTGGMTSYDLTTFEKNAVYHVTVWCDGEQLTDDALDRATLEVALTGGNAKHKIVRAGDGYDVFLQYNGSATETQCGEQKLQFSAKYVNTEGREGQAAPVTKSFTLKDDSVGLEVELQFDQKYYVISKLGQSSPVIVKLTSGGAPLTPAQFSSTVVDVKIEGMLYDIQPDAANSSYIITFLDNDKAEKGFYQVECQISGFDTFGRPVTAQDSGRIELQQYSLWVRILFWVVLVLIVLAIIWTYLNTKILPKKITVGQANFVVNGKIIPGKVDVKFTGGGKRRGTLTISSPKYAADPAMKCGMRLDLVADSPRRVRSAQRRVKVVAIVPASKANTTKLQVGGTTMVKNNAEQFVRMGTKDNTKVECTITNNTRVGVAALVLSPVRGKKVTVTLSNVPLKFL